MSTKPPNLRDAAQRTHKKDCRWAKFLVDRPGDVRQCEHGKIQVVDQPMPHSPGTLVWEDLHPFWNRRPHKLAKELLSQQPTKYNPIPAVSMPPAYGQQTSPTASPEAINRLAQSYSDNE
ncbi:hypothetical protein [Glutamicibacter ardleyensis]|uniref:hypothetical protein n=1 Tax=Glutamicibacter ardleyensis TaxID=225894 RepID=UPI003FD407B2